ncbi:LysR family transcriptional regulator [Agrobacterium rhizogenes]|uniref:LysR family transcriptional regulator n=1 Tax=Rhizobium rhizogenes TaxID=359 RepID=UPI00123B824B|nr:LysR family transcriptional regulator [Rhizobium rhizogenes]KAA6483106.1 LysR family transcriptional regulator [Agrobacterium sp. ICMP 7243]NTF51789.1 LysR family transcriptional regulator [Rhizobium rhizogenes]NTG17332.1 LysR family transcriptional regulator [Rhizobium rhizogenes]NTG23993.1 LysR family transcriptional regulator [Rhizobium rhizogenes]NTG30936.1 LysR family transcriptional regulator [Rhizobium rhizogenes]
MNMRRSLVPDIANLQAFECAARHGNFTRAAEELNLTQSAVSRQIHALEEQTGLLLFERVRRRVILSEPGKRLLSEVQRLLAQSEQLMMRAVASADKDESLTIATLPTFGARWLMPRLPDFLASHPSLALTVGSRSEPFDFDQEDFDLAIHYGQPSWAKATSTFLYSELVLPVASRKVVERLRAQTPANLADAPLLHLTTRPRLWSQWLEANGVTSDNGFRGNRFDQFSMIIGAALADMGVALLPSHLIEEEIRADALVPVFDLPMATEFSYYVVLPEGRQSNGVANAFKDWLISQASMDQVPALPRES